MAKKELSEQQKTFLAALFSEECAGNFREAMRVAGYSDGYKITQLSKILQDEIADAAKNFLRLNGVRAAWTMAEVMEGEGGKAARDRLSAAKEILDRGVGVTKVEKVEIEAKQGLIILPAKDQDQDINAEEET